MDALLQPPIGFAHRGARIQAPENTLAAFELALRLGAPGLESDVWLTGDGIPVLDHDGAVRSGVRRRPIAAVERSRLPPHIPTLEGLYGSCGTSFQLSLDIKDPTAATAVVAVARAAGDDALGRLWLCHSDWQQLAAWRAEGTPGPSGTAAPLPDQVRLVDSTRLRRIREGPERRAARLADAGVDAINMHATDWTAGLTTLFHRFLRLAFGWDAQFEHSLVALLAMGCDAVYSDHVERMVAALQQT
ncbi:MAG: glycerophosphodiester phosphodiesterase [Actinomycetota bacterium]|nr:glycerophosphodiester phosphodiesterase [Actinomycetota bacterium]